MKKLAIVLCSYLVVSSAFGKHRLDFNDDRDIITCENGAYTLSKNSSKDQIIQHCEHIGGTPSKGAAGPGKIEFKGDNKARAICTLVKDKVDKCWIID